MLGISVRDQIRNEVIRQKTKVTDIVLEYIYIYIESGLMMMMTTQQQYDNYANTICNDSIGRYVSL